MVGPAFDGWPTMIAGNACPGLRFFGTYRLPTICMWYWLLKRTFSLVAELNLDLKANPNKPGTDASDENRAMDEAGNTQCDPEIVSVVVGDNKAPETNVVVAVVTASPLSRDALGITSRDLVVGFEPHQAPGFAARLRERLTAGGAEVARVAVVEQQVDGRGEVLYRSADIVDFFGERTRSIRPPKLDLQIQFALDSSSLDGTARRNIDEFASALADPRLSDMRFQVSGHTDDQGTEQHNMGLSMRRAETVRNYLIEQGGRKKFLEFVGVGMRNDNRNWEEAVKLYGYGSTDDLQEAWIESLRTPPSRLAARKAGQSDARPGAALVTRGSETRSSALPGLPMLEPPIVARGAAPAEKPSSTSVQARPTPPSVLPKLLPPEPPGKK